MATEPPGTWLHEAAERAQEQSRAGHGDPVQQLLHAVRVQLGMELAWTSEFANGEQVFRYVDAESGVTAPAVGSRSPLVGSYCARVLDGRAPSLIPDARREPAVAVLDVTHELQIGSYVGAPLVGPDGTVSGMLCATSRGPVPTLGERDLATLRLLAQLLHDLQLRALDEAAVAAGRARLVEELTATIGGAGRWPVVQPVVDARSGDVVFFEGLTRFASDRTPAEWFDAARRAGLDAELELAAAASVLDLLREDRLPAGVPVSVNLSPRAVLAADLNQLFAGLDPTSLVVELTERHPVEDYGALGDLLDPWRGLGLRLAVDDTGAGYAGLQHVLMCAPDLLKLDMALVRGVDVDPVRRALLGAVLLFASETGVDVVAEGVETEGERRALVDLGVPYLQGYLLGEPSPVG